MTSAESILNVGMSKLSIELSSIVNLRSCFEVLKKRKFIFFSLRFPYFGKRRVIRIFDKSNISYEVVYNKSKIKSLCAKINEIDKCFCL